MKQRDKPERLYGNGSKDIATEEEIDVVSCVQGRGIPGNSPEYSSVGIISGTPTSHPEVTPVSHHTRKDIIIRDRSLAGGFAQVPNVVLRDPQLTSNAVRLYCLILSYAWSKDSCWPGHSTLGEAMGVDRRTIVRTMAELNEQGLISWKRRGLGQTNLYFIESLADKYSPNEGEIG